MFGLFGGKSFEPENDIPDLSGKVIIVTGGNTNLLRAMEKNTTGTHILT
jgi:hypothetical protein